MNSSQSVFVLHCVLLVFEAAPHVQTWRFSWYPGFENIQCSDTPLESSSHTNCLLGGGLSRHKCVLCYLRLLTFPCGDTWSPPHLNTAGSGCSWFPPLQQRGCFFWCCWLWWVFTITVNVNQTQAQHAAAAVAAAAAAQAVNWAFVVCSLGCRCSAMRLKTRGRRLWGGGRGNGSFLLPSWWRMLSTPRNLTLLWSVSWNPLLFWQVRGTFTSLHPLRWTSFKPFSWQIMTKLPAEKTCFYLLDEDNFIPLLH